MLLNSLGRVLVASGLVAVTSFMASTAAFAGTTGTVNLSSSVPSNLSITVTPLAAAGSLNLAPLATVANVQVATIAASTNSALGLKVTPTSTGLLSSGLNTITYTIGEAFTTGADLTVASVTDGTALIKTHSSASGTARESAISVSYTVPAGQAPGVYTGFISFTAVDNP